MGVNLLTKYLSDLVPVQVFGRGSDTFMLRILDQPRKLTLQSSRSLRLCFSIHHYFGGFFFLLVGTSFKLLSKAASQCLVCRQLFEVSVDSIKLYVGK
jgi:hypothetical protein